MYFHPKRLYVLTAEDDLAPGVWVGECGGCFTLSPYSANTASAPDTHRIRAEKALESRDSQVGSPALILASCGLWEVI